MVHSTQKTRGTAPGQLSPGPADRIEVGEVYVSAVFTVRPAGSATDVLERRPFDEVIRLWRSLRGDVPAARMHHGTVARRRDPAGRTHRRGSGRPVSSSGDTSHRRSKLADAAGSGLLIERERGIYAFAHLTFQEYLAARHICDTGHPAASYVDDPWWRESLVLAAQLGNADAIITACLESIANLP
jgi:hypothetical protein